MARDPLNVRPAVEKFLRRVGQEALWDAINEYAAACGGDTSDATVSDRRMNAVVAVERAVAAPGALHPHTAALLEILDRTEDAPVRCMADLQALVGRVRQFAAAALGETLPEDVR